MTTTKLIERMFTTQPGRSAGKGSRTGAFLPTTLLLLGALSAGAVHAATAPSILVQPRSQTVSEGRSVWFLVYASGTAPLAYQWSRNGNAIPGATSRLYFIRDVAAADNGAVFTVKVSNTAGSVTSKEARLTVRVMPAISAQPASQTVNVGQTATFAVTASGTEPLHYQWRKNGSAILGATAASYTTPAATAADDGARFAVTVTNSSGSVASAPATLTVRVPPSITTQPQSQSANVGQSVTFTVVATGTAPLSYQWNKNGAAIPGATAASYTTTVTDASNGASFTVTVSNAAGSVVSAPAKLIIKGDGVRPSITTQPQSQTVNAGQTATFTVVATGTAPLSYQWSKNGTAIPDATAASYTTPPVTAGDNGAAFTVMVSNRAGSVTSDPATLTVPGGVNYLVAYNSDPAAGQTGLVNDWIRSAWEDPAISTNFSAAAPGRPGQIAVEVSFGPNNGWNAIGFAHRRDWNNIYWLFLNQFRTVEFDIQFVAGSTGADRLQFIFEDAGYSDNPFLVSLIPGWASMTDAQRYGNWHHVAIDLAAIHPSLFRFEQFLLWNAGGGDVSRPHFFLSNVKLGWVEDSNPPVIAFGSAAPDLTYTQLTLAFATNEPALYRVDYGQTTSYGQSVQSGTGVGDWATSFTVPISNLTPGVTYYYRITARDHQFQSGVSPNLGYYTGSFPMPAQPSTPPTISGLSPGAVDAVSAVVNWTTDRPCTAAITYQKSGGAALTRNLTDYAETRSFTLDLLEPSSTYLVTVVATDAFGNVSNPASISVTTTSSAAADVTVTIDPSQSKPISPWIYGLNFYRNVDGAPPHLTLNRMGGNRWTAYNWENNASNAGSDWGPFSNDSYLGGGETPAEAVRSQIAADQNQGLASLMTIQMQGYVSADKNGNVNINDPNHLADRFQQAIPKKSAVSSALFTATPPLTDDYAFMDEFLWALRGKFSGDIFAANAALPTFVSLDNEPELWNSTHEEIQTSTPIGADAYIQKTVALAKALKDVAPEVQLFGPVHYGFQGLYNWQGYSPGFTADYWFTDKYLQELKTASDAYGRRLLDVYDFHWYAEVYVNGTRITNMQGAVLNDAQIQAIVQSPRDLWDPTYNDGNWPAQVLGGPINILGRVQAKIDAHWPGTRIAITEYNNGGDNHIAGTIAQADNLGVFGAFGVYAATHWPLGDCPYILAGFRAFRGFDGAAAHFGDTSLKAASSDVAKVAAYVSLDSANPGRVVIVAINRSNASQRVAFDGQPLSGTAYVYRMTADSAQAQAAAGTAIQPTLVGQTPVNTSSWTLVLPPLSVSTIEVR